MSQKQNKALPNQKKGGTTMYKLTYQEHIILKQAAYQIMQHYNKKQYTSNKKQYIKYNQTLQILYKKTTTQLLDIIDRYQTQQDKLNNKQLIEHNLNNIKVPRLRNLTDDQVQQIATRIQQLETKYYLYLDTDYTSKQSILEAYQQLLAYKHYKIPVQQRLTEELIGNAELLERKA